jgi:hypothetical protein
VLDGGEPLHQDALLKGLLDLGVVRRHPLAGAPVDDHGFLGAQPLRGPGDVDRSVAAAVDRHAASEQRQLAVLDVVQDADRVEDARGLAGGHVGPLADLRTDGQEHGVEAARRHLVQSVLGPVLELEGHAHVGDALDLGVEDGARQPVLRDAEAHHAARERRGVAKRHSMAEPTQVVRR